MERVEEKAQVIYSKISKELPDAKKIVDDEDKHEHELIDLIDEERLEYEYQIGLFLARYKV